MNDQAKEILDFLEEKKVVSGKNLSRKEFDGFKEHLKSLTPFLPENAKPAFRIRCIVDGVTEIPICKKEGCCNHVSTKPQLESLERWFDTYEFTEYCSRGCMRTSAEIVKKRAATTLERHGAECFLTTEEYKEKAAKTNMERYGCVNPQQSEVVKQKTQETVKERYGVTNYVESAEFREKARKTNIEKFGVAVPSKSEVVKQKIRETNSARYGAENAMQCEEIRKRHTNSVVEKYGVDNVSKIDGHKEKCQVTSIERYGVPHFSQSEECRIMKVENSVAKWGTPHPMKHTDVFQKLVEYNQTHYGVDHFYQSNEFKDKSKKTMLERYGVDSAQRSPLIREKTLMTNFERYGCGVIMHRHIDKISLDILKDQEEFTKLVSTHGAIGAAAVLGVDKTTVYNYAGAYGITFNRQSSGELSVCNFLESIGVEYTTNDRSILPSNKELDVVIPSKKIAIEFNGVYWHSTKFRDKNYHLDKTNEATDVGYRLIHIYEDDWNTNQDAWKMKLASILGVDPRRVLYARKLTVQKVDDVDLMKEFYSKNHVQGFAGQTLTYGLFSGDNAVAMMSFKRRSDSVYELSRYATSERVVGGFSRLFKNATAELSACGVTDVTSFADLGHSAGNMYIENGWTYVGNTRPDYRYVVGDVRVRKQNFRRNRQATMFDDFDPAKTEMQNMIDRGFYPCYDCGLMKFTKKIGE